MQTQNNQTAVLQLGTITSDKETFHQAPPFFIISVVFLSPLYEPGVRDSADEETPHYSCYITQVHEQLQVKLQEARNPI